MHPTTDVYSDLDIDKIETFAPSRPHRAVDLAIVEADTQDIPLTAHHQLAPKDDFCMTGHVKTYIAHVLGHCLRSSGRSGSAELLFAAGT